MALKILLIIGLLFAAPEVIKIETHRAIRGPGTITWIQAISTRKEGRECSVELKRIGHVYKLGESREMLLSVNPGEIRNFDYAQVKEFLGNDLDYAESLDVDPDWTGVSCATVKVQIQRTVK